LAQISLQINNDTDWSSVQAAAERWADLFRQFLDANLAR